MGFRVLLVHCLTHCLTGAKKQKKQDIYFIFTAKAGIIYPSPIGTIKMSLLRFICSSEPTPSLRDLVPKLRADHEVAIKLWFIPALIIVILNSWLGYIGGAHDFADRFVEFNQDK